MLLLIYICFNVVCPFRVVLCWKGNIFSFSFEVKISSSCLSLLVWNSIYLSLGISKNCFSSDFCFLIIVVLFIRVLLAWFMVVLISLFLFFFMQTSKLTNLFPPFLDTYSLPMSSLGCKSLWDVMNFLYLQSSTRSFFSRPLVEWSRGSYKGDKTGVFLEMSFLLYSLVSSNFLYPLCMAKI